jgi:hypothetical protein
MATQPQAKRALEKFEEELSGRANVVGLGVVPASDDEGDGMAVGVYVRKCIPSKRLPAADRIPDVLEIRGRDQTIEVPTRVIELGEVALERTGG